MEFLRSTGVTYDAAGDTSNDSVTAYTYDAEGRIISAVNSANGTSTYVYDAEGRRIRKPIAAVGNVDFTYDLGGHEIAQFNTSGGWRVGEVYAGGRHLATYTNNTTYFVHADWLGTERARSTVTGTSYEACTSLPFGDGLTCTGTDVSPMHFTRKERDPETASTAGGTNGLDDFGARYDSSSMGRFMTPDWSTGEVSIPNADLNNPQSLNLYTYVGNNPLSRVDLDGHCWSWVSEKLCNWLNWGHWVDDAHLDAALQKEAAQAREDLANAKNMTFNGQSPRDFVKGLNNKQAIIAQGALVDFLASLAIGSGNPCGDSGVSCGIVFPFPMDFPTSATVDWSASFGSEGEARAFARTKLGSDPIEVEPGKWRSSDGKWQYRAKPGDVSDNHVHLEQLNPETGEVIQNLHIRWPEGSGRE